MNVNPDFVPHKLKPEAELNLADPKVVFEPTFERTPINRYILDAAEDKEATFKELAAQYSTRIVKLKDGKIIEQGSHNELIKKNGVYAELYELQFSDNQIAEKSLILE